jgi:phosphoenolpyruvate carboxykinase (GTP)
VNWFRQDKGGKYLWPGYGENMRVLKWIVDRVHGRVVAQETMVGWVPRENDLDLQDLEISKESVKKATQVDLVEWKKELETQEDYFKQLGKTAPEALLLQRKLLLSRLSD